MILNNYIIVNKIFSYISDVMDVYNSIEAYPCILNVINLNEELLDLIINRNSIFIEKLLTKRI